MRVPFQYQSLFVLLITIISFTSCKKSDVSTIINTNESIIVPKAYKFDLTKITADTLTYLTKLQGVSPAGTEIKVNNKYVEKDGIPWIPIYGEFHFSRYPETHWEDAILKMKSSGMNTISSYIFWNHHEEVEGKFNWTGRRNLRKFIELCAKHNMYFFARIGPWAHGEARYGGHPDWLIKQCTNGTLRSIDPKYLVPTERLYKEIAEQMKGLYWKDGGPVFAIQLDNENWEHGPNKGLVLMEAEKRIALKYGMDVPIYTCTGWANAEFPQGEMIPTFGSYADYFWTLADTIYRGPSFSFSKIRPDGEIGTDMGLSQIYDDKYLDNPYFTCETGIGMNMAYHRRTNITPDDNAVLSLIEIGNGCNSVGYFIFHGGRDPMDQLTRMNESLETGHNDNSVVSNDFQAAVSEYGEVRPTFHKYPIQFGLLNDFGNILAPMNPMIPAELDEDPENSKIVQRAIRTDGSSGFIFVTNHIKHDTLYNFKNVQFDLKLKDKTLLVPENPITIPAGSYFIWPFNLKIADATLTYATAQLFSHIKKDNTYFFFENEGIPAEFVLDNTTIASITTSGLSQRKEGNTIYLTNATSGKNCFAEIITKTGKKCKLVCLTEKEAHRFYKHEDRIYISDGEVLLFNQEKVELISEKTTNHIWVYPPVASANKTKGIFSEIEVNFTKKEIDFEYDISQNGTDIEIPSRFYNKNPRLGVPEDYYFDKGTIIDLNIKGGVPQNLYDVRIVADYTGSAGRMFMKGELVADNYYNGTKWVLSTSHLTSDIPNEYKATLKFLPLQPKDPIYINSVYWPDTNQAKNVLNINSIKAIPVYKLSLIL